MKIKTFKNKKPHIKINDFDMWSLDITLSSIIYPLLIQFKENHNDSYPSHLTFKEWEETLDKMILAHKLHSDDKNLNDPKKLKVIEEGLTLFGKYYTNLWS